MTDSKIITDHELAEESQFYEALGRLVAQYAMAEAALYVAARRISVLTDEHARIIFSGMRLQDVIDRVRALIRSTKYPSEISDEFEACIAQLSVIHRERDRIVHRAVSYEEGKLAVTNLLTAKDAAKAELHNYSLSQLRQMQADCVAIVTRLVLLLEPMTPEWEEALKDAQAPWRYKP